jgi:hypothetical protein
VLVNLIRVGAVELGERDLAGLRNFRELNPVPLAYYIQDKDIWHENGLVSSAVNMSIRRIYSSSEMKEFLASGGAVILQDSQSAENDGLACKDWIRLRKRMKFPLVRLLSEGIDYGDPSVMRSYQICAQTLTSN